MGPTPDTTPQHQQQYTAPASQRSGSPDSQYRNPKTQNQHRKSEDHIASFRTYLSDLLKETDEFQLENDKLKEEITTLKQKLIHSRKDKLLMCFDHNTNVLMSFVFGEWKQEAFEGKRLRFAKELELRSQEMQKQMADRLRLLEEQASSRVNFFQAEMEKMTTKHKRDLETRDAAIIRSEEEMAKKERILQDLQQKVSKMDTFLLTVAEQSDAVKELAISARGELDEANPKGKHYSIVTVPSSIPQGEKKSSEFMKDSLHDILARVDPRYMPRMIKNPMSPVINGRLDETCDVTPVHATILDGSQQIYRNRENSLGNTGQTQGGYTPQSGYNANGAVSTGGGYTPTNAAIASNSKTPPPNGALSNGSFGPPPGVSVTPRLSTPTSFSRMMIRQGFARPMTPNPPVSRT